MTEQAFYEELLNPAGIAFPQVWREQLPAQLSSAFSAARHGRWPELRGILERLPAVPAERCEFGDDVVEIAGLPDVSGDRRSMIEALFRALHPWRKGPFRVHGVTVDAEWRSNLKWRRIEGRIAPLRDRAVLDIGCGNGYYAWRMLGQGARRVVGIDPNLLHVVQFLAIKHFAGAWPVHVLPLGIEDVPPGLGFFDTVFSMGVLYHRRSPIDHLLEIKGCLRSGGELVLETLVVEGGSGQVLLPDDRYAQMRNVWFIPSVPTLAAWLRRCGFRKVTVVDVSETTVYEQRSTSWMRFHSLADFLDPEDPRRTVEGLPAPCRAVLTAEAP